MRQIINIFFSIAAPLLSGALMFFAFPDYHQAVLAWVALVPVMLAIAGKKPAVAFLLSLVCGICFFLGLFNWILVVSKYSWLHHTLLALYLGSYIGIFGLAFAIISRRINTTAAFFAAPFIWIALEFARSNMSFIALPWGLLAHSQYQTPLVIQIASLAGVYSVSFLMVAMNCAVAACVYALQSYRDKKIAWTKGRLALISGTATLFLFALFYGNLLSSKPFSGERLKLALVQGNINQSQKWDPMYAGVIMRTYAESSLEVSKHKPDLIVWPETATPRAISMDPGVYREVKRIVNLTGTNLLLGSSQPQKFKKPGHKNFKYYNSAFLITPGTPKSKPQRYDKIRLFPFGEYLPYRNSIPWASISVPDVSSYVAGKEFKLFELPPHRFGVTICWENMFPDLFRQFVKNGAQFMVNLTNEAWFGKTEAPDQFLSMSVFRAVENRVFVVRCTNTGISCFIDPNGRVYGRVEDSNGEDTFIRGFKIASIVPQNSKTFYTRYGDWLVWLSLAISLGVIGLAMARKTPQSV